MQHILGNPFRKSLEKIELWVTVAPSYSLQWNYKWQWRHLTVKGFPFIFSKGGGMVPPLRGGDTRGGDSPDQGGELRVSYTRQIIALYFCKRSIFKIIILSYKAQSSVIKLILSILHWIQNKIRQERPRAAEKNLARGGTKFKEGGDS